MDEELKKKIETRIEQLKREGDQMGQAAYNQAVLPYNAAINELARLLQDDKPQPQAQAQAQ